MSNSHRDARPLLEDVPADDGRVVRGPVRDHDHPAEVLDLDFREPDVFEHDPSAANPFADRLVQGGRLLVDLLEHERLVALLLCGLVVPVDLDLLALDLVAAGGEEAGSGRRDGDDLAVLDELHAPGLAHEGGDGRREERLLLAQADQQRALQSRPDEQARMLDMGDDESEVTLELGVDGAHRGDQVAVVVVLDEVRYDLGVRLGREHVPGRLQAVAELAEVLDDAVENDGDGLVAARQRMGVLLADATVGRPAGVADAGRRSGAVRPRDLLQMAQVADRPHVVGPLSFQQAEPGRVVATVFESLQALQKQILCESRPDVSDDAAHPVPLSEVPIPNPLTSLSTVSGGLATFLRSSWVR